MPGELISVAPPQNGVYRIARHPGDVFLPPPWEVANPADGTFGHRFDDPTAAEGNPPEKRFRMVYCGSNRTCALMESVARFRTSVSLLARLSDDIHEPYDAMRGIWHSSVDPDDATRGVIPAEWRARRQIGHAWLDPSLRFADLGATRTLNHLRQTLADAVLDLGLSDIDLSAVTGPHRILTQRIARSIYEQMDEGGTPRFAGIRYLSRYGDDQDCWAIFDDRMVHTGSHVEPSIPPDDEDLLAVARAVNLSIEMLDGHYLRP